MVAKADRPSAESYEAAAWFLMAEPRAVQAVAMVESGPEGAFLPTGEPVLLFERHLFSRLTAGRYDGKRVEGVTDQWSLISNQGPGGYGPASVQHKRLQAAAQLDRDAALKASSWGLFQILGLNHARAGYTTLRRFVNAMYRSVDDHLRAFVMFIRSDDGLIDALRSHDWASFARAYNGPNYKINQYDVKMASAYSRLDDRA